MVHKGSKHGLNTGNTLRRQPRSQASKQYQKYSCLVVGRDLGEEEPQTARHIVRDLVKMLPSNGSNTLEFSLNKQRRWELPEYLKSKVEDEFDSEEIKITVLEHTFSQSCDASISNYDTCTSYYSNVGRVRECVSSSEMNIKSAKQGYRDQDHLSKLERRAWKKKTMDLDTEDIASLPSYECHIGYSDVINGKFYKGLTSKRGFQSRVHQTKSHGKRKVRRFHSKAEDVYDAEMYADEAVCGVEYEENTTSATITASLADFISAPVINPFRSRLSSSNRGDSDERSVSKKQRIVYINEPIPPVDPKPQPVSSTAPPIVIHGKRRRRRRWRRIVGSIASNEQHTSSKPTPAAPPPPVECNKSFTPNYTEILIRKSDIEIPALRLNMGDSYTEGCCIPRTFTINLSPEVGVGKTTDTFYMVLVVRAEGIFTDRYRAYCAGTHVTDANSSCIPSLEHGIEYDLITLKKLTLEHGRSFVLAKRSSTFAPVGSARHITSKRAANGRYSGFQWNINSSHLSELTDQTVSDYRRQNEMNLLNNKASGQELVFIPTQGHRVLSCDLQCKICFEDLNDAVPHSAILPCQHYFCNECWAVHLTTNIREGKVHIACPEYACTREVDPLFIMSIVDYTTYSQHVTHLTEYSLFSQKKANWCPNIYCNRVLHCDDDLALRADPVPVKCPCGTECCFKCLREPHWPLTCSQMETYYKKLGENGLQHLLVLRDIIQLVVVTKPCPTCHIPIDKDGGCATMTCTRCNTSFCWKCGTPYHLHYSRSCQTDNSLTTRSDLSYGLHETSSNYFRVAGCHRIYKAHYYRDKLRRYCSRLLANASVKSVHNFRSQNKEQSLRRYLHQAVQLILAAHNILEFCNVVNAFKKGAKYCVPTISVLTYQVDALERQMAAEQCSKHNLQLIVRLYDGVKMATYKLAHQMSGVLSLVKPVTIPAM